MSVWYDEEPTKDDLVERYKYKANYVPDWDTFKAQVLNKTIKPHQVEFQPGPTKGHICWLKCPYCYGGSAQDTGERLPKFRYKRILSEIAERGVNKVIFAGYCTDPLNYFYIEDLLATAIGWGMVWGFNTKAIQVSNLFLRCLTSKVIASKSYINISVDAGNSDSYNRVHGTNSSKIYDYVLNNAVLMAKSRKESGGYFDISASYLVNGLNNGEDEIRKFVADFKDAGCDLIRFTFAQLPRGKTMGELPTVPTKDECIEYRQALVPLVGELNSPKCAVIFVDADSDYDIYRKPRTLPCIARWVYPTIGFDGWLYHCSQSSAPNFRKMALGNLESRNFWDLYYDYDPDQIAEYFYKTEMIMDEVHCRCDRKEHILNQSLQDTFL